MLRPHRKARIVRSGASIAESIPALPFLASHRWYGGCVWDPSSVSGLLHPTVSLFGGCRRWALRVQEINHNQVQPRSLGTSDSLSMNTSTRAAGGCFPCMHLAEDLNESKKSVSFVLCVMSPALTPIFKGNSSVTCLQIPALFFDACADQALGVGGHCHSWSVEDFSCMEVCKRPGKLQNGSNNQTHGSSQVFGETLRHIVRQVTPSDHLTHPAGVSFCRLLCAPCLDPGNFLFLNMLPRNFVHVLQSLHMQRQP